MFCRRVSAVFVFALLLCVSALVPQKAFAQSAAQLQELQQQQDRLQRQEQNRRRAEERELDRKRLQPPEAEPAPEVSPLPEGEKCIDVTSVRVDGVTVLSAAEIAALTAPYEGKCLTVAALKKLLDDINQAYHARGYVTSRAFLSPQDIKDGLLIITVQEGSLEELSLKDDDSLIKGSEIYFTFPAVVGDLLNLRDIEQGLDQMNRLASNNATMEIIPGKDPGTSRIVVTNAPSNRLGLTLSRDNSGSRSTGLQQNRLSLRGDNLLGINDGWQLGYSKSAMDVSDAQRARSLTGSFSVPFGYWTLQYSGSYSDYSSLTSASAQDFYISGLSRSHEVGVSRIVHRDQVSKTRLDVSVTAKENRNYVEDSLIETGSRKLSIGEMKLSHSRRQWGGVLLLTAGHEKGLKWFDALRDEAGRADNLPKAQFSKWTFDGSYQRPFAVRGEAFSWRSELSAATSPDVLYGTEQFSVGGSSSVRGFRDESLSSDNGYYVRNELDWTLIKAETWNDPFFERAFGQIMPYIGYDWGSVHGGETADLERGTLSGMTVGVRNSAKNLTFDLAYARALSASSALQEKGQEIYASISLRF